MSERAESLRDAICGVLADAPHREGDDVVLARAICEHLELTWEDVGELRRRCMYGYWDEDDGWDSCEAGAADCLMCQHADRFQDLLEAAYIEPPEQP